VRDADVSPMRERVARMRQAQQGHGAPDVATVVLTRPAGRNESLVRPLTAHGVRCVVLPALERTPTATPAPSPQDFDLILFVSGFAAQCYLQGLQAADWPDGVVAAGVGSSTLRAIRECGVVPPEAMVCPSDDTRQDSEALWQTLQAAQIRPRRVLIVRGDTGRDWLRRQWQSAGVQVQDVVAYHRRAAAWTHVQAQQLREAAAQTPCVLLVTSADSARAIDANLRRLALTALWGQCRILTLHPRIADCVGEIQRAAGVVAAHPVKVATPDARTVLQALLALVKDVQAAENYRLQWRA